MYEYASIFCVTIGHGLNTYGQPDTYVIIPTRAGRQRDNIALSLSLSHSHFYWNEIEKEIFSWLFDNYVIFSFFLFTGSGGSVANPIGSDVPTTVAKSPYVSLLMHQKSLRFQKFCKGIPTSLRQEKLIKCPYGWQHCRVGMMT